jgi:AcrR family transcriptional regulator
MPRDARVTRDRILSAAQLAFFRRGFSRVTMDDIAGAAGLTKRTLYQHFDSKDSLLGAMLAQQHDLSAETYARSFRQDGGDAGAFVARLFDDLEAWARTPQFVGSGFTRLATELGDLRGHPAMRLAHLHKATLEGLLSQALAGRGVAGAGRLAREVWLLMEGAMILALLHRDPGYVAAARDAALKLVALEGRAPDGAVAP